MRRGPLPSAPNSMRRLASLAGFASCNRLSVGLAIIYDSTSQIITIKKGAACLPRVLSCSRISGRAFASSAATTDGHDEAYSQDRVTSSYEASTVSSKEDSERPSNLKRVSLRRQPPGKALPRNSAPSLPPGSKASVPDSNLARVCIIGRPNVGKSTLFNRLVGKREVLVYDTPASHVTRDYQERRARLGDLTFRLVDTSGMEPFAEEGSVQDRLLLQTERVVLHSDAVLFLLDARSGLMPGDLDLAKWLRSVFPLDRVVLAANKSEMGGLRQTQRAQEIWADGARLGFGEPVNISALTGDGLSDLYAALQPLVDRVTRDRRQGTHRLPALPEEGSVHSEALPPADLAALDRPPAPAPLLEAEALMGRPWTEREVRALERGMGSGGEEDEGANLQDLRKLLSPDLPPLRVSFVGLPNVGKSTLLNAYLGRERVLVGPEAGLTRDVIMEPIEWDGAPVVLQDTPGALKPRSFDSFDQEGGAVTQLSQQARTRAMQRSDLVAVVVDASQMRRGQRRVEDRLMRDAELELCVEVMAEGRALLVVANKLDAVPEGEAEELMRALARQIAGCGKGLQGTALVGVSALGREGLDVLMKAVWDSYLKWNKQIPTGRLNRWLAKAKTAAVGSGGSNLVHRVRFLMQVKARPPTFAAFLNGTDEAREEQVRGLANALKHDFGFEGSPIRIKCRYSEPPTKSQRLEALHRTLSEVSKPLDAQMLSELSPNDRRVMQRKHNMNRSRLEDKISRFRAATAGKTRSRARIAGRSGSGDSAAATGTARR